MNTETTDSSTSGQGAYAAPEQTEFYLRLVLVLLGILSVVYAFTAPVKSLIYVFSDDAYYYFKVAQNIVSGLGSTFDGFNRTNGYHPMWMIVLLPIYALTKYNPLFSLRIAFALICILTLASLYFFWSYLKATGSLFLCLIGVLLFLSSPSLLLMLNGLESGLLIFWIFLMLFLGRKYQLLDHGASLGRKILLGCLFGILVLIRIDSAFFVASLVIFKLVFSPSEGGVPSRIRTVLRTYWPTGLIFIVLVLPYFVFSYLYYGHLLPISGSLKTSFPEPHFNLPNAHTVFYFLGMVVSLIWVIHSSISPRGYLRSTLFRAWQHGSTHAMLAVFWLGCLFHLIWSQTFMQWGVYQWHYSAHVPVLVILTPLALKAIMDRLGHEEMLKIVSFAFVVLLVCLVAFITHVEKGSHHLQRYEGAMWARDSTPPNTVFSLHDAGCFAYFSERPTVNLDGVINSYEFQDAILEGRLQDFLDNLGVRYIAAASVDSESRKFGKRIRYYQGRLGRQRIWYDVRVDKEAEVYATEPAIYRALTQKKKACFVIWDFSKVDLERTAQP